MSARYFYPDSLETRFAVSFVNLTRYNATLYPAITTVAYDYRDSDTTTPSITTYRIYPQFALRVATLSGSPVSSGV